MERELWKILYALVVRLDKGQTKAVFCDSVIVGVFFWAVMHDRPISWACDARNWPRGPFPRLPSQSTMSRRLRSIEVQQLMNALEHDLTRRNSSSLVKVVDAKPLPVSWYSKDPEAKRGHGAGSPAKGYKLFAIWGSAPLPLAWRVAPMNSSESRMAQRMIPEVPQGGYLLGDSQYDTNPLHQVAREHGHQLVAPQQRPSEKLGHHRHDPGRLRSLALLKTDFGQQLFEQRIQIEQRFGSLTNFGGGLSPLPSWVRREYRVRLWVQAKLLTRAIRTCNHLLHPSLAVA
jgi:hypothetical protein